MNSRATYKTKQRELLLEYFETVPGVHVTAADVCDYFRSRDAAIGKSTVYRHLERLVDEGIIKKYIIDGNTPACFEYVEPDKPGSGEICYHCKCEKCGKPFHLYCNTLNALQAHLEAEHHFRLDPVRTVLYGVCENCK